MTSIRQTAHGGTRRRPGLVAFAFVAVAVVAVGYWYYRAATDEIVHSDYEVLAAVTEVKNEQIQLWRQERLADVGLLARDPALVSVAAAGIRPRTAGAISVALRRVERSLSARVPGYCRAMLVTPSGEVRLSVNECRDDMPPDARSAIRGALAHSDAVLSDFFAGPVPGSPWILMTKTEMQGIRREA